MCAREDITELIMYDEKLESMSLKDLYEESSRLQKMLVDGRHSEAVRKQIIGFMNNVDQRIAEVTYIERFHKANEGKPSIIEIGETEEVVYTPDYTKKELLDAMVFEYSSGDKNEKDPNGEEG